MRRFTPPGFVRRAMPLMLCLLALHAGTSSLHAEFELPAADANPGPNALAESLESIENLPDGEEPAPTPAGTGHSNTEWRYERFARWLDRSELSDAQLLALLEKVEGRPAGIVAVALADRGRLAAREPLLALIQDVDAGMLRAFAARALGQVGDERDLPLLRDIAANDPLRRPIYTDVFGPPGVEGARRPGDPLPERFFVRDAAERAIEQIEQITDDLEQIEAALREDQPVFQLPRRAIRVPETAAGEDELRERLGLDDTPRNQLTEQIARRLRTEPFSSDWSVDAIQLLGRIDTPQAAQLLHRIAREEFSIGAFSLAAYYLVQLDPPAASQLLRSRRTSVVNHALYGIRGLPLNRDIRSAVERHINSSDAATRSLAADVLLQGVDRRQLPAVLRRVAGAMHKTSDISRLPDHPLLTEAEQHHQRYLHAILESRATADQLRPLAARQQGRTRDVLDVILARRGDLAVRDRIRELAGSDEEATTIYRVWAVHALAHVGTEDDVPMLESLAADEQPRTHHDRLLRIAADHALEQLD